MHAPIGIRPWLTISSAPLYFFNELLLVNTYCTVYTYVQYRREGWMAGLAFNYGSFQLEIAG